MQEKRIIGLAGMPGAGKGVIKSIVESMRYPVVIMGDEIRKEAKRRGLKSTPETIGELMIRLRKEHGPTVVIDRCISKISNSKSKIVFVDGIRSLHELERLKEYYSHFVLIAVHSSPTTRFHRVSKRKRNDDPTTWEIFSERDSRELSVGQGSVIAVADFMIVNEATLQAYKAKINDVLEVIIKKWMG